MVSVSPLSRVRGGGAYFVVADGNAGDVAASQNLRVFFCLAVLVEDSVVVQAVGGVHVFYCSTHTPRVSTCVDTRVEVFCLWSVVGWLFPARLGVCLPVGARGLGICGRGIGVVGVWVASRERAGFGWRRAYRLVGAGWLLACPLVDGGVYPRERAYVRLAGGFGMWRPRPSLRSCSASRAVMTRPMMGGHCCAYLPPAHTARSWAASCGADTGFVVCSLSGLVYPSVVSSASGPIACAQRWVSRASVAAMLLTVLSPRYGSPVAVVSPWPSLSPACFRFR